MRETQFNSEVMTSLKAFGAWSYKIADSPTSWTMARTRFTPEKPCDIVGCYASKFFAIEGKQIKSFKAFGMNSLRQSQIDSLNDIVSRGGAAFVFLNIRIKAAKSVGVKQDDRLLIFEWTEFKEITANGSLKKKIIENWAHLKKVTWGDDRVYDLRGFLGDLSE
jgi:penicillin-binding protein-related factor A (putative recombinase)